MLKSVIEISKSILSHKTLSELYERRKALRPSEENRTKTSMTICGVLFISTLFFLMYMAWQRQNVDHYISSMDDIVLLPELNSDWEFTEPELKNCRSGTECYFRLSSRPNGQFKKEDLANHELFLPEKIESEQLVVSMFRRYIPSSSWASLVPPEGKKTLALNLPKFRYGRADVFFNGEHKSTFYRGQRINPYFISDNFTTGQLKVEIVFEISANATHLIDLERPGLNILQSQVAFLPASRDTEYIQYKNNDKSGRGDTIGMIARIVMAVFVLVLFMIIDGSPETLGLGLFLGFEGIAISLGFDWLTFEYTETLRHFCYQMGDIFRLFFFLQLARIINKNVTPWLLWGGALSLIYGLGRQFSVEWGVEWVSEIPAYRDFFVGTLGTIVCVRTALYLTNKGLPWRVIALAIAAIASFEQAIGPTAKFIPQIAYIPGFIPFMDIMQPAAAWLIAFSAFINISTLENRVKVLTEIESHARTIEKEMELARAVQQAFLNLPQLPSNVNLVCHHEAMLYVSGDTYFADWNEEHQRLTFLINDVTGHGMQAALKASGVSVIANTVWTANETNEWEPRKLQKYSNMVQEFFEKMNETPDIVAMGGGEFCPRTGTVSLFRRNFPFPIVISPKSADPEHHISRKDDNWVVHLLSIPNDECTVINIKRGAFVVYTSDGFLDNSRRAHEFVRYLRRNIGQKDHWMTAEDIKTLILECKTFHEDVIPDDRTLTVFQWKPKAASKKDEDDNEEKEAA